MRERINLDVDTYAAPCISDHCASALPGFLSSDRAVLPRRVIGKFPRGSFVRSMIGRSIDTAVASRHRSSCKNLGIPQIPAVPFDAPCVHALHTRASFDTTREILQGQWRRRRKASLTSNRFHREKNNVSMPSRSPFFFFIESAMRIRIH